MSNNRVLVWLIVKIASELWVVTFILDNLRILQVIITLKIIIYFFRQEIIAFGVYCDVGGGLKHFGLAFLLILIESDLIFEEEIISAILSTVTLLIVH